MIIIRLFCSSYVVLFTRNQDSPTATAGTHLNFAFKTPQERLRILSSLRARQIWWPQSALMQAHATMHHIDSIVDRSVFWFDEFDRKMTLTATSEFWNKSMLSGSLKTSLVGPGESIGLLRCQNLAWKVWNVIQLLDQQWSTRYMLIHSASLLSSYLYLWYLVIRYL